MTCAKAVPLYVQLKEHVLQNIRSGEWRSGERVRCSLFPMLRAFGVRVSEVGRHTIDNGERQS